VISKLDIGDPSLIFLDQKRCAFVWGEFWFLSPTMVDRWLPP
jgi:hypothetical protein